MWNVEASPRLLDWPKNIKPLLTADSKNKNPDKQQSWLSLLGGVAIWNMGYGETKPEREAFENTILSYQAQLNYLHPLKKQFHVLIGLQYQQLENQFDGIIPLEGYKILLQDTVVQIQVNTVTGEETKIYGDVELTVPAKRVVRHYNKTRLLQIPFAIGKTWTSQKWQADLLLGGSLSISSQNKGRTLYEGAIVDYDDSTTNFIKNDWKLSAMIGGRLTYRLTNHVGLTSGISFQRSLMNWSLEANTKMKPNIFNLELGLSYSL